MTLLFFALLQDSLYAGAASTEITPALDKGKVWMAGFNTGRPALGVHDPLWARALSIRTGDKDRVVLVALDLIGMLHYQIRLIQDAASEATHVPPERILVCCTHVHSGPDTLGLWGSMPGFSGLNPDYMKTLREKVAEAVKHAVENEREARLTCAQASAAGFIRDSRDPKILDENVEALLFRSAKDDAPLAVLVEVACHPEGMGRKNQQLTSDFPHYLRRRLEKQYSGATAIYVSADIGALQTPKLEKHGWEAVQQMGETLADRVIEELNKAKPEEGKLALAFRRHDFEFRLDNPMFRGALKGGLFGKPDDGAREDDKNIFLKSSVTAVKLGRVTLVTMPGEVAPEVGRQILEKMPGERKLLLGLANDEVGYIFRKEDWTPGQYEESMSLGADTAPTLLEAYDKLLKGF
jgi:hypothetical protein